MWVAASYVLASVLVLFLAGRVVRAAFVQPSPVGAFGNRLVVCPHCSWSTPDDLNVVEQMATHHQRDHHHIARST